MSDTHSPRPRPSILGHVLLAIAVFGGLVAAAYIVRPPEIAGVSGFSRPSGSGPAGSTNTDRAHTVRMPDGYSNVATKCSGVPGKRVWVASDGNQLTVTEDSTC